MSPFNLPRFTQAWLLPLLLLLMSGCSDEDAPPIPPPEIPRHTSSYLN